jgi:hypothetical protein
MIQSNKNIKSKRLLHKNRSNITKNKPTNVKIILTTFIKLEGNILSTKFFIKNKKEIISNKDKIIIGVLYVV